MTQPDITPKRVLELIEAFGGEPGGWPEDEREAAAAFIAADPDMFDDALRAARALDSILFREFIPEPSAALAEQILAAAPAAKRAVKPNLLGTLAGMIFPQGVRWPAGAALASLSMGLVGGYAYASTGIEYDQADSAYVAAFGLDGEETWIVAE